MAPVAAPRTGISTLSTMADLPSMLEEGDLLCLDIDETLVSPEEDANEAWFVAFCAAMTEKKEPRDANVFGAGVELWQALQGVCAVQPPEQDVTRTALAAAARVDLAQAGAF